MMQATGSRRQIHYCVLLASADSDMLHANSSASYVLVNTKFRIFS